MRAVHWILITTIGVMLSFVNTFYILAAPTPQAEPPLEIEITTAQAEATVGAPMTWRILLMPREQEDIGSIELQPGDKRAWAWANAIQTPEALTSTVVLTASAVPLVSGDLFPILEVHYDTDGEMQTQLVLGNTPVHVEPVEKHVDAGVISRQGTVRKGDHLPVEFWIRNGSPFTLTQVQMCGCGADLTWGVPMTTLEYIPAGTTFHQMLTPTIEGQHPQPQLSIEYVWTDATGHSYDQILYISGEAVALEENIIGRIPDELFTICLGLVAGVLSTLLIGLAGDWLSHTLQKKTNRRHVHGLLRLTALQSEHAAENGVEVDLAPIETIFKEKGLFTIMEEDRLAQNARDLWKTAKRHNNGLNQPGGAQRSEELSKAAQKVTDKLDRHRNWPRRWMGRPRATWGG